MTDNLTNKEVDQKQDVACDLPTEEVFAAIAMALHEENADVHDWEDTRLTIKRESSIFSPWSAKFHTLRHYPGR